MESFPKSISQWVQWVHETHQWLWGPGVHPWDDYTWKVEMPSDFFLDLLSEKRYGKVAKWKPLKSLVSTFSHDSISEETPHTGKKYRN